MATPQPLLFPNSLDASAREIWERDAVYYGYETEATLRLRERFPQREKEPDALYGQRIEAIRRHEAAVEAGRARPEQNARTHGFSAQVFSLAPGESEETYEAHVRDAIGRYQPQGAEELAQVVAIVNANWLLGRLQCAASALMCEGWERGTKASDAFSGSERSFATLARYEGTVNRTLDRAKRRLKELQSARGENPGIDLPENHEEKNYKTNAAEGASEPPHQPEEPHKAPPRVSGTPPPSRMSYKKLRQHGVEVT